MLHKIFKKTKQVTTSCDLFSNTELMRYKENPQYKSANGGICSIAVILAFAIIFTQTIINTFNKSIISSTTTLFQETQPSEFKTTDSPFLFALGLTSFNLNNLTTKYFNIEFYQTVAATGKPKVKTFYTLQPCDRNVWTSVDPNFGPTFDKLNFNQWLCLPPNITLQFQGKFSSNMFKYVKISVKPCTNDSRTCANQSIIDNYIAANGAITLSYYFMNTIINADNQEYLGRYLEDRNYFQFTKDMGITANLFISSYDIQTDQSLLPMTDFQPNLGGIVYEPTQSFVIKASTEYLQLYIRKSSLSLTINRSFKKYDDTLSYIGGLFSSIMGILFIMLKYNQYSYQIDIASEIYKQEKKKKIKTDKFNILRFFQYSYYCVLDFIGAHPNSKIMKEFDQARQEIGKQLDLRLILRKISFLQDCMQFIFQDFELKCLHLRQKMTLDQAANVRKRFSLRPKLIKLKKKFKNSPNSNTMGEKENNQIILTNNFDMIEVKVRSNQKEEFSDSDIIKHNKLNQSNLIKNQQVSQIMDDNSISSVQTEIEEDQKLLYEDIVQCIHQLQIQAKKGKQRCKKIYQSLDKEIKNIEPKGKIQNINSCHTNQIQRQISRSQINQSDHEFQFNLNSQKCV